MGLLSKVTGGDLLGLGGDLVGAYLGSKSASADRNLTESLSKNRITNTVIDAKRAGIHPLYALAASSGGSPVFNTGNAIGDGIAKATNRIAGAGQRATQKTALDASATKDIAIASAENAQAALYRQEFDSRHRASLGVIPENDLPGIKSTPKGTVEIQPNPQITTQPDNKSIAAGTHPFWQEFDIAPGIKAIAPRADNPAESLEGLGALVSSILGTSVWWTYSGGKKVLAYTEKGRQLLIKKGLLAKERRTRKPNSNRGMFRRP